MICLINFSILPPNQSQKAPARQSTAPPHTAVLDTSDTCFAVLIIPLTVGRTAASQTPVSPPTLTPAAGTKYHRPHPQQRAGHNPLSRTSPPHQLAGHTGPPLSCHLSRQVESTNSWISGIGKDYPDIIPLGAMHPEHPDSEAETCGCGSLE